MTQGELTRRLVKIKAALAELGPIHPGSISEQYNVCGTPGCACKDAKNPQKHGPYYQLSYSWRARGTTRFVRAPELKRVQAKLANYKRLRGLVAEWGGGAVAFEALGGGG